MIVNNQFANHPLHLVTRVERSIMRIQYLLPRRSFSSIALLVIALAMPASRAWSKPSPVPAEVEQLFKGCQRVPSSGGLNFACGKVFASAQDVSSLPAPKAVESLLAGLKASLKGEMKTEKSTFSAGGRTWPSTRVTATKPGSSEVNIEGQAFAFNLGKNTIRLLFCGGQRAPELEGRCGKMLAALAAHGPAPFAPPLGEPKFLGQKIRIPAGCQTVDASDKQFRVACGETAFVSSIQVSSVKEIPKVQSMLVQQMISSVPGAAQEKDRPCSIGGVASTCKIITAGTGAARSIFYFGSAVVKKVPVLVQCAQLLSQKGVHKVCAEILSF